MTTKLSEPMQNVLMKLGTGWGWDDFGVTGPLSHAARVRTCEALQKRGLVAYACGDYDLTEAGEALAKRLNEQEQAARLSRMSDSTASSLSPRRTVVSRHQIGLQVHARLDCGHDRNERVTFNGSDALVVTPGETMRCFYCAMVDAGLLPSEAQRSAFLASTTTDNC